jgi:acyl carrier protein
MDNNTPSNIISTTIEDNSLDIANHTELKQNGKAETTFKSKTQSCELLMYEVDNIQDYSDRICQNWLKAHKTDSLCSKNVQEYTKIVILLQDITELIERIKTTIQSAQLQKQIISETVNYIVSNCLDIEPEQVAITANLANDLGIDSLSWQELLITLEETFTIIISDEIAGTLTTVQQLIDCVILIVQKENRLSLQLQS